MCRTKNLVRGRPIRINIGLRIKNQIAQQTKTLEEETTFFSPILRIERDNFGYFVGTEMELSTVTTITHIPSSTRRHVYLAGNAVPVRRISLPLQGNVPALRVQSRKRTKKHSLLFVLCDSLVVVAFVCLLLCIRIII